MTLFKGFKTKKQRNNAIEKEAEPILKTPQSYIDAKTKAEQQSEQQAQKNTNSNQADSEKPIEVGGPKGLEPTRYGDWEKAGRCSDF